MEIIWSRLPKKVTMKYEDMNDETSFFYTSNDFKIEKNSSCSDMSPPVFDMEGEKSPTGLFDGNNAVRRVRPIRGHFSPRSPDPVHFFGHIREKIGHWFLGEAILGPGWQESHDSPAKNRPV